MTKITWIDKNKDGTGEETLFRDTDANEVKTSVNALHDTVELLDEYVYAKITEITTVIDTYQMLTTDQTVIGYKATPFTITLPNETVGQTVTIKNVGAGDITVEAYGADTIDGELNVIISQWQAITLQCYAVNVWGIVGCIRNFGLNEINTTDDLTVTLPANKTIVLSQPTYRDEYPAMVIPATGDALLEQISLHVPCDTAGSRQIYVK